MEENIHDDKLDDYVRKSFEDYEASPPEDMWDRVEEDLVPVAVQPKLRVGFQRLGWQALAAGVILALFSTLVCEHMYYEAKLRNLSFKPVTAPESLSSNQAKEGINTLNNAPNPNAFASAEGPKLVPEVPTSTALEAQKRSSTSKPKAKTIPVFSAENTNLNPEKAGLNTPAPFLATPPEALSAQMDPAILEKNKLVLDNSGSISSADPELQADLINAPNPLEVAYLPASNSVLPKPNRLVLLPVFKVNTPNVEQIKPLKEASGWYIGAQTSFLAQQEKARPLVSRPGRAAFVNKQENSALRSIFWVQGGKEINPRISLETGLGYEKSVQTASHSPRFRFGDGIPPGPPFGIRRAFNYDLSTYGGTAEVSLRMEETTGSNPTDDEPVSLKINTEHRMEMLRIPLLLKYRVAGKGPWQAHVKVGLLGNLIVKNELDISARVSENARFKPVSGADGYTVQLKHGKFFMGYWLSAGAAFKVNSNLRFYAEPALVGDFPRNDPYKRQLPKHFLLGLNVGANYYF